MRYYQAQVTFAVRHDDAKHGPFNPQKFSRFLGEAMELPEEDEDLMAIQSIDDVEVAEVDPPEGEGEYEYAVFDTTREGIHRGPWPREQCEQWVRESHAMGLTYFYVGRRPVGAWERSIWPGAEASKEAAESLDHYRMRPQ
jgi:hypothetical protein